MYMDTNIKVPFAIYKDTSQLVSINDPEVFSGLHEREYICPCCNNLLVAKKGEERQHHFSHYTQSECTVETYYHKITKLLLQKYRCIMSPPLPFYDHPLYPRTVIFDEVRLEESLGTPYVFDAVGYNNKKPIYIIEVMYSHKVSDPKKFACIKNLGLLALEIDIRTIKSNDPDIVKNEILETTLCKRYLHIPMVETLVEIMEKYETQIKELTDELDILCERINTYEIAVQNKEHLIREANNKLTVLKDVGKLEKLVNKDFLKAYKISENKWYGLTLVLPYKELLKLPPDKNNNIKLVVGKKYKEEGFFYWVRINDHIKNLQSDRVAY